MKKPLLFVLSKLCVLIFTFSNLNTIAQTIIYSTNFGNSANVNPAGWTFTGVDMTISTNNTSSGYTGASGDAYLGEGNSTSFINTSGTSFSGSQIGTSRATLTLSTLGHTTVAVSFGMRKSSANYNTNATYAFEWSTNGTSYTTINYTEASAGNWGLASGSGLTLPAGAGNQPILYLRWSFVRTGTGSNFKIDDFSVTSTTGGGGSSIPSIDLDQSTTDFLNFAVTPVAASGVINDVTDPCRTKGIIFSLADSDTPLNTLTVSATSSNSSVVSNTNLTFVYVNGATRILKINPTGVGYSNITVTVTDGSGSDTYVLKYAASAAAYNIANTDFHTGISDASTAIDAGNNYFLSGDDESNGLHLYHKDSSGYFLNAFDMAGPIGFSGEGDFEASCRKGNKAYWMGSLGNSKSGNIQTSRHYFFGTTIAGTGSLTTASYMGSQALRSSMISWGDSKGYNFTASAASGMIPKQIDGLNIEGMCLGPNDTSLYIGFRAPLVPLSNRTKALICPIKNFEGWFNNGSPSGSPQYGNPIELNLGGRGIRSMEKNANGQYLIVAGSFDSNLDAALYEWNGVATSAPVLLTADLTSLNPEGIVSFPSPFYNGSTVELMSDDGTQIWYNDATENKALADRRNKKFRTVKVVTTGGTLSPCVGASLASVNAIQPLICVGENVVININGNLNGASAWHLYTSSCGSSSLTSTTNSVVTVSPTTTTTYYVRAEGGCALAGSCSAITVSVSLCTNVSQHVLNNSFEIYPNPVNDLINISAKGVSNYDVVIYNSVGELILTHHNQGESATIFTSDLAAGIYYIRLITEYGIVTKKIIKR